MSMGVNGVCPIMEYGSTPYVGMAPQKNGVSISCVLNDTFKTLLEA